MTGGNFMRSLIAGLVTLFLLLVSHEPGYSLPPPKAPKGQAGADADADAGKDKEAILKLVQEAQRAGWLRHDIDAYMRQWAKDAKLVHGRSQRPSRYDVVFSYDKLKAVQALRFRGRPLSVRTISFSDAKVKVKVKGKGKGRGRTARLTMQVEQKVPGSFQKTRELYRLRKTKHGWRVDYKRTWPFETGFEGGTPVRYTPATWKNLDQMVKRVRAKKNPNLLARALLNAYRYTEAHLAMRRQTGKKGATAADWALRGVTAALAGDAKDAMKSFRRALALDPGIAVPGYARKPKKK
jgi:hypothetical protein